MQDSPTEQEEDDHSTKKDPFILLGPAFNHSDCVSADTQSVGDAVQPALRALQYLTLLAEIRQHSAPTIDELIKLRICCCKERLLAYGMDFPVVVCGGSTEAESGTRVGVMVGKGGCLRKGGLRIWVLRSRGVVRTSAKELVAVCN